MWCITFLRTLVTSRWNDGIASFYNNKLRSIQQHVSSRLTLSPWGFVSGVFSFNGTATIFTSWICAQTEYIPYVAGVMRISSWLGVQQIRIKRSIASSLPTPRNTFFGSIRWPKLASLFLYQINYHYGTNTINQHLKSVMACFNSIWYGHG